MLKCLYIFSIIFIVFLVLPFQAEATYCTSNDDCNDNNGCTLDTCEGQTACDSDADCDGRACSDPSPNDGFPEGFCTGFCENNAGPMDGKQDSCSDGNVCSGGQCIVNDCSNTPANDGQPCQDANVNPQSGVCQAGECFVDELICPSDQTYCADIDQCITPVCNSDVDCGTDGVCQNAGQCDATCVCGIEGQECDDGDPNTTDDVWSSTGGSPACSCSGTPPGEQELTCTISASPNPVTANTNTLITLTESALTGHNKHKILYGDGADSGLYDAHNSSQTHAYASNGNYTTTGQLVNYTCGFYFFGCLWYNETVEATCTNSVTVAPSLFVSLSANPSGGDAPLSTILSADVSGSATGTINYTFWWNCSSDTTSVATAISSCGDPDGTSGNSNGIKFDGVNDDPKTVSHTYAAVGTYTAKVIAERDVAAPAEERVSIPVTEASEGSDWVNSPSWKTPIHPYPQVDFNCSQDFNTCNPPSIFKTNKQINFADLTIFYDDKGKGQRDWLWNFGDGTSSIIQNPTKTYTAENIYNVTETVTDKDGYTCSLTRPLNVQRPIPIWKEVIPLFSP
ncbi:MAG: PKD domain-containing protein [Parcubacteria group bacterium]|nr:PKD domain-containing protein [Parcubacteria group bacterium]